MDWFKVVMLGMSRAPSIINFFRGVSASGVTKQEKVYQGIVEGVSEFGMIDPEHAKQVLGHPKVQEAIKNAQDWIYYAGKVADAVGSGAGTTLPSDPPDSGDVPITITPTPVGTPSGPPPGATGERVGDFGA